MARLQRGENDKIDRINDLVAIVKCDNNSVADRQDAMAELLSMFKPMMISICGKWSDYFNDSTHKLKPFAELLTDAEYWFINYTVNKYDIDGDATYNKFIKDHINQRIRYIYECQLKYYNTNIFPDPDKHQEDDGIDPFESVVYRYSSDISQHLTMEDNVIDTISSDTRAMLAQRIMSLVQCGNFNDREKKIFIEVMYNGVTQDEMSKRLGISRTRVVQILRKIKSKLRTEMEKDSEFWSILNQTDIVFDEITW